MKVLFAGLALLTAWLITSTVKNRNKMRYLKSKVAQLQKIIIKIEKYGKETKEGKET